MVKKYRRTQKKELNKILMAELRMRGIRYLNMRQCVDDLAKSFGIEDIHGGGVEARRRLAQFLRDENPEITKIEKERAADQRVRRKISQQKRDVYKFNATEKFSPALSGPSEAMIKEFYASWEWKRLSYDVKIERGRKCECCGAQAPKVVIHTDHVKPIRKYWHLRLDKTNLQILCEDCNMGKGSRHETDFRELNLEQVPDDPPTDEEIRMAAIRDQLRLN